ncbi:MAG: putative tryptophan/tyrosine transport system permease protein [Candidatus Atribacteria bacterium]|nr:putative tryptophan/tyrosine transport system permease protein [Candidatus Atribacteria bacterium]
MIFEFLLYSVQEGLLFGILALGVFLTFRCLDFPDLTVDGSYPLGAAVFAFMAYRGVGPVAGMGAAFLAGAMAGFFTGFLHTFSRIPALLSGILTMICLYSINLRIMGRPNISLSENLGHRTVFTILRDFFPQIPEVYLRLAFLLGLVLVVKVLLDLFLRTEIGLAVRATGDNEALVEAQGINPDHTKLVGISLSNALVALSGALFAQFQGFVDINMGIGMVIAGLASVIVGEVLLRGRFIFWITFQVIVGSVVYRMATAIALNWGYVIGFQPYDLKLFTGLLVIIILSFPVVRERLRLKKVR